MKPSLRACCLGAHKPVYICWPFRRLEQNNTKKSLNIVVLDNAISYWPYEAEQRIASAAYDIIRPLSCFLVN